jgi:hypothetical protein
VAQIIRDTTYRWRGPWLIEMQDLSALDTAVSEAKAHIAAAQHEYDEARISAIAAVAAGRRRAAESAELYARRSEESEKRARENYAIDPLETTVEFELATSKKIRCKSISEGLANSEVIEGRTVLLSINLEAVRRRATLTFDVKEEEVCINAYPTGDAHIEIAFAILKKWAASKQPSRHYRFWGRSPFNAIFLLPVVWAMVDDYRDAHRRYDTLQNSAVTLVDHGVTQADVPGALELLLRAQFGLRPTSPPMAVDWATLAIAGTILIVTCVLLFGRPAAAIGIGRTREAPTNRRRWVRFWLTAVPLAVFGCLVIAVLHKGVSQH